MPFKYISERREFIRLYYKGLGKTAVIYPTGLMVALALGMVSLGVIFYVREEFHATATQVGLLTVAWCSGMALGCVLLRPLFDRVAPRHVIVIGCVALGVSILAMLVVPATWCVIALMGMNGLSMAVFWPQMTGWLYSGIEGKTLSRAMGRFRLIASAGILSPFIAGWLSEVEPALPLLVAGSICLAAAFLVAVTGRALPAVRNARAAAENNEENDSAKGRSTLLRYPAWLGLFCVYFTVAVLVVVFPLVAKDLLHLRERLIGGLLVVQGLAGLIVFLVMSATAFWHFRSAPMLLWQLIGAGAFITLAYVAYGERAGSRCSDGAVRRRGLRELCEQHLPRCFRRGEPCQADGHP